MAMTAIAHSVTENTASSIIRETLRSDGHLTEVMITAEVKVLFWMSDRIGRQSDSSKND